MNIQLQGALAKLRQEKMELVVKGKTLAKSIKELLATSSITPLEDLDIESVYIYASELKQVYDDYREVQNKIKTIEKELEGGF